MDDIRTMVVGFTSHSTNISFQSDEEFSYNGNPMVCPV